MKKLLEIRKTNEAKILLIGMVFALMLVLIPKLVKSNISESIIYPGWLAEFVITGCLLFVPIDDFYPRFPNGTDVVLAILFYFLLFTLVIFFIRFLYKSLQN